MIRPTLRSFLATAAMTVGACTLSIGASNPALAADKADEQIVLPVDAPAVAAAETHGAKVIDDQTVANAPVFEGFDIPLPPRRPALRVVKKVQPKTVRVVAVRPARVVATAPVAVASAPLAQFAMVKQMPKVWITVGSGF